MSATPCPVRVQASKDGDRPALITAHRTVAYKELDCPADAAAARLVAWGCTSGTRVGLYLPNSIEYAILLLALMRAGSIACPLSTRYPAAAVTDMLRRIGSTRLITDESGINDTAQVRTLEELLSVPDKSHPHTPTPPHSHTPTPSQPVTAIFTSGSTGTPKAALHTWGSHYYNALGSNANIPLAPGDRWLLSLPLYHVGGLAILFRCWLAAAAVVIPEAGEPPHEAIPRYGITHVSLVATQLHRLLQARGERHTSLKAVLMGGSAIPPALIKEAVAAGLPVYTSYGLTEMASQVTTTAPASNAEDLRTSGRVLPYREVSISPEGEILVRGKTLFAGYLESEQLTRPIDAEGWYHTRDLGMWDEQGRLRVLGRRDNLFISGGENIQPEEIERTLLAVSGIEEAVVVPVPDAEFGHRPVAFIRASRPFPPEALTAELEAVLPRFKLPVAYLPLKDTGPSMKVDRHQLKRIAIEQLAANFRTPAPNNHSRGGRNPGSIT